MPRSLQLNLSPRRNQIISLSLGFWLAFRFIITSNHHGVFVVHCYYRLLITIRCRALEELWVLKMCNRKINKSRLVHRNVAAATEDYVKRFAVTISNKSVERGKQASAWVYKSNSPIHSQSKIL